MLLADSPPGGSQEPILFTSPGISQAHSPGSRLLFFLIKVARARIPSPKGQPRVWMSSSRLCHCCARLCWRWMLGLTRPSGEKRAGALTTAAQPTGLPAAPVTSASVRVRPSVMSNSLRPHGQKSRAPLLCPWDSLGKNTRVGCHSLLQGIFPTQGSNQCLLHFRQILYC